MQDDYQEYYTAWSYPKKSYGYGNLKAPGRYIDILDYLKNNSSESLNIPKNCAGTCEHDHSHGNENHHGWKAIVGLICGAALLVMGFLIQPSALMLYCITGTTAIMTFYLGKEAYFSAIKNFFFSKERKLTMDALYMISTLTIVAVSIVSLFIPGFFPGIPEAAPLILGFRHVGEAIEEYFSKKMQKTESVNMSSITPMSVIRIGSDGRESCLVDDLQIGDIISVAAGELIPADCVLLNERTRLEASITNGESSKAFEKGDLILAGTCVPNHTKHNIQLRVIEKSQDSYLSKIDKQIKEANHEKIPAKNFTDQVIKYFIPILLLISIASSIVIGMMFSLPLAIQTFVTVMVSMCPCIISLAGPLALEAGKQIAASGEIHFKNVNALLTADKIKIAVFDLTGTLIVGRPEVTRFEITDNKFSEEQLFQYATLLEEDSEHPIAKAITRYASEHKIPENKSAIIGERNTSKNSSIEANIDGKIFTIGNETMLCEKGIAKPFSDAGCVTYLVCEEKIIGKIFTEDTLRHGAEATIKTLQDSGKEIHICTGASKTTAKYYAEKLSISEENIHAECKNAIEKGDCIAALQQNGRVAMFGDGGNDGIALAKASLGVFIDSEIGNKGIRKVLRRVATVAIDSKSLDLIPAVFEVPKKARINIWQNLTVSLLFNLLVILAATGVFIRSGFLLAPWMGTATMCVETGVVFFNLWWFSRQKLSKMVGEGSDGMMVRSTYQIFPPKTDKNALLSLAKEEAVAPTLLDPGLRRDDAGGLADNQQGFLSPQRRQDKTTSTEGIPPLHGLSLANE